MIIQLTRPFLTQNLDFSLDRKKGYNYLFETLIILNDDGYLDFV